MGETSLQKIEKLFSGVVEEAIRNHGSEQAISALQFAVGAVRDEIYISSHPMSECIKQTEDIMRSHDMALTEQMVGALRDRVDDKLCLDAANEIEYRAAALWRSENPEMSVFSCDSVMKDEYRRRVVDEDCCSHCGGSGNEPGVPIEQDDVAECSVCHGSCTRLEVVGFPPNIPAALAALDKIQQQMDAMRSLKGWRLYLIRQHLMAARSSLGDGRVTQKIREQVAQIVASSPESFRPRIVSGEGLTETEKEKHLRVRNVAYFKADQIIAVFQ